MGKYLLVYTGGGEPPRDEAARAATLKAWTDWFTNLGAAVVDQGNPTAPGAKSINSYGHVSDASEGTPVTGYSILQADSLDKAVEMARLCPQLAAGGGISVYETFNVM